MLGFYALGRAPLGMLETLSSGGGGETGETGEGIPTPEVEADILWPVDDLKPRDIGIYPVSAPIGGGVSLSGREPTVDSGAGYWRFTYGAIPIKDRDDILTWRGLEAEADGRGRTFAIVIYDGKRAPWPDLPGGDIDAESVSDVLAGTDAVQINPTNIGDIEAGMHFSVADRFYQIISVQGESAVFDCVFWPPAREAWPAGMALEFRRPLCRVRLADDAGLSLDLDGHKRAEPSVEFVEAL